MTRIELSPMKAAPGKWLVTAIGHDRSHVIMAGAYYPAAMAAAKKARPTFETPIINTGAAA